MQRWMAVLALCAAGCMPAEDPVLPARVQPEGFTTARSWVGRVASDGDSVFWANYDASSGKSTRTVLDRAALKGGAPAELLVEAHPPPQMTVHEGHLYWIYARAPLKRVPVGGGEPEILRERGGASCFDLDASGLYLIDNGLVMHLDLKAGTEREVARDSFGDCPVLFGDQIYWTERKGIFRVPKAGGIPEKIVDTSKPKGLIVHDGALFSCFWDTLMRIDPATGDTKPIRDFCQGEALAVTDGAHWVRRAYFEGWPATEKWRLAEVTSEGPSWLYDGLWVSDPVVVGNELVWFGRDHGSAEWRGYKAPLP